MNGYILSDRYVPRMWFSRKTYAVVTSKRLFSYEKPTAGLLSYEKPTADRSGHLCARSASSSKIRGGWGRTRLNGFFSFYNNNPLSPSIILAAAARFKLCSFFVPYG